MKEKAFQYFLTKLLNSQIKEDIGGIFLFGSFLSDEVDDKSDIDRLIFSSNRLDKVREVCADLSFRTSLEYGESIEPSQSFNSNPGKIITSPFFITSSFDVPLLSCNLNETPTIVGAISLLFPWERPRQVLEAIVTLNL